MDEISLVHEKAIVEPGARIGAGTRVWAFAHILPGAVIGKHCNICDHVFIENDVVIGDRVTVKCGIYIWDGVRIEESVFLGPNVVFTNDAYPRSKQHLAKYPLITIRKGASVGANATILPGVTIGQWAMVGAASLVNADVEDYALVIGSPARKVGYVCVCSNKLPMHDDARVLRCTCGREYHWNGRQLVAAF